MCFKLKKTLRIWIEKDLKNDKRVTVLCMLDDDKSCFLTPKDNDLLHFEIRFKIP